MTDDERQNLDAARAQLEEIARVAAVSKAGEDRRKGQIQVAYGHALESLNNVFALQRRSAEGGR